MTRDQMRTLLRSRIQEQVEDKWTDEELNGFLNSALRDLQLEILVVDKKAFLTVSTANLYTSKSRIPLPAGCLRVLRVEIKDTSSGEYGPIGPMKDHSTYIPNQDQPFRYSIIGKWLRLTPAPSEDVTAGIRLSWAHTLTMSDDNDIPEVPLGLHDGIVHRAKILAFQETEEKAEESKDEWSRLVNRLNQWYVPREDQALPVEIEGV